MDTKLKKSLISYVAAVLCVFFLAAAFFSACQISQRKGDLALYFAPSYEESLQFEGEFYRFTYGLRTLLKTYGSEEAIRSGQTATPERLNQVLREMGAEQRYSSNESADSTVSQTTLEKAKHQIMQKDLNHFHQLIDELSGVKGFYYYVSDGTHTYTNQEPLGRDAYESQPVYFLYDMGTMEQNVPSAVLDNQVWEVGRDAVLNPQTDTLYLAFSKEYMAQNQLDWQEEKDIYLRQFWLLLLSAVLALLLLAVLIYRTGSKKEEGPDFLAPLRKAADQLYTDVNALFFFLFLILPGSLLVLWQIQYRAPVIPFFFCSMLLAAILLILLLALVRHIKTRTLFRHSLLYQLFHAVSSLLRRFLRNKPFTQKLVWMTAGYSVLLCASLLFFPFTFLLLGGAIWYVIKKGQEFCAVADGAKKIRQGETSCQIKIQGKGELAALAEDINSIAEGLDNAIEKQLKSERMKTELITNVSHDIRTPLTSIITYVDLLKKEVPAGEKINDHIAVLEQKSTRLKELTDDLFEAAKASSGSIETTLEQMDLCSLLTQGMGELDDQIHQSCLSFKVNAPVCLMVIADGKLLWRVLENLFSNVFKYALAHSRVYIDITSDEKTARLTMKNIANYELNVPAEELMQRFTRADSSRHTEGSGLGLSIAESLMEAQNGNFHIEVDGDLFKAIVELPLS